VNQTASVERPRRKFLARVRPSTDLARVEKLGGHDAWRSASTNSTKPINAAPPPDGYVEGLADGPYPGMFVQQRLNYLCATEI
jgi:hypothetical protein